jgi:ABC-type lipoprotein export system ATPase subunit/ABC-type transporter Mla maintaining outer membrane lipid asymmetry permease subunit MlaE
VAEGLEVSIDGRTLLARSDFEVRPGEFLVVAGPSGAGKSLLLDLLVGAVSRRTPGATLRGRLLLGGRDLLDEGIEARAGLCGAVLQSHRSGLFDDLTLRQNLRFGSRDRAAIEEAAAALGFDRADLKRRASRLSGGERVRAALARALLARPPVLLCDEPTTGQDERRREAVVAAIRAAHRADGATLVVTHDPGPLRALAAGILFLDPASGSVRRLPPDDASFALVAAAERGPPAPPAPVGEGTMRAFLGSAGRGLEALGRGVEETFASLGFPAALPLAFHPLHGPGVRRSVARALAPGVSLFAGACVALIALTLTYFLFARLPRRAYSEPLVQDDLVSGVGLVLLRVVVPLIGSILLAAKLGASAAARFGLMVLTRQVDALRLLSVGLRRHLLLPLAGAHALAFLWHLAVAAALAYAAALVVFLIDHPGWSALYFDRAFWREIGTPELLWGVLKVGLSGLVVAAVAYRRGTGPVHGERDLTAAIHGTLLESLLLVVTIHSAIAFLEF